MESDKHNFLEKAQNAAESIVKNWVRGVFRETSLQVLRQQWTASKGDDGVLELGIEPYMLDECERICHKLATNWEKRLMEQDQSQVALWVREISSENDFWSCNNDERGGTKEIVVDTEASTNKTIQSTESIPNEITETEEDANESRTPNNEPGLPLTKLWNVLYSESDLKVLNERLSLMGKEGDTQWPADWQTIEQMCKKLKLRLHSKSPQVRFEIVPKEIAEPEEQKGEVDVVPSARFRNLLDKKKRKSFKSNDQVPQMSSAYKRSRREVGLIENARPPSSQPARERWHWNSIKSSIKVDERERLEKEYIHGLNETDPPNTILGALLSLGSTHYALGGGDDLISCYTNERKRRLTKRKIMNERLESKTTVRNERKRPVSKVIRTQFEDQQFIDLDMGECMVELNGKPHAFASLEISLSDNNVRDE
mmetsp:Transcript_26623/g.40268  ORF Transcript_26623/g.40268 Transcript_26623/m.40268 type:complete len:426 (+) Transcript_26623:95-1372(+)